MRSPLKLLLLLSAAVFVAAQPVAAGPTSKLYKLDLGLREALTKVPEPQHVIVRTKAGCRPALRSALTAHGDVIEAEHPTFEALTAYVHGEDLEALANDPCVATVSMDAEVSTSAVGQGSDQSVVGMPGLVSSDLTGRRPARSDDKATGDPSELRRLLGLNASDDRGDGIGVAIFDSGLELSSDFDKNRVEFWDFTRGGIRTTPYDDYGHGTHVAGLIAGSGRDSGGKYGGVAPEVQLRIFKVLDRSGRGRTSQVLRALEYVIANRHRLGVDVINLSLGHPILESAATDPLVQAVEIAVRRGFVVVVSAGNNGQNPDTYKVGYGGINSPGNAPSAITVGAADTFHTVARLDDGVPGFSSRGPTWYDGFAKPDVVAPGVAMISNAARRAALYQQYPQLLVGSRYASLTGTSMAAAVTAGLVAAIMSADRNRAGDADADYPPTGTNAGRPFLTSNAIKAVLEYTATPLRRFDLLTQGAGEINGNGALVLTRAIDTTAPLGATWVTSTLPHATKFAGISARWFENIVWGNFLVDGRVVLVNSRAWDNIVWGNGLTRDSDNIVWGNAFTWNGDNIVWGNVRFSGDDNIVWGAARFADEDNIVWGNAQIRRLWANNIVWGNHLIGLSDGDNIVWGNLSRGGDNIVWGNLSRDNIVWGNLADRNGDNIVWGNLSGDNIVWGNDRGDNIVWGNDRGDNIVWGNGRGDNIVWGNGLPPSQPLATTTGGVR